MQQRSVFWQHANLKIKFCNLDVFAIRLMSFFSNLKNLKAFHIFFMVLQWRFCIGCWNMVSVLSNRHFYRWRRFSSYKQVQPILTNWCRSNCLGIDWFRGSCWCGTTNYCCPMEWLRHLLGRRLLCWCSKQKSILMYGYFLLRFFD